jgi:hypothetical protein
MPMPPKEREEMIGKWSLEKPELLRKYLAGHLKSLKTELGLGAMNISMHWQGQANPRRAQVR